jgi:hypothetical protein
MAATFFLLLPEPPPSIRLKALLTGLKGCFDVQARGIAPAPGESNAASEGTSNFMILVWI